MGPVRGTAVVVTACLVLVGIFVGCAGAEADPQDRWVAEDKVRHFTVSAAATTLGYGAGRFALDRDPALVAAGGVALALGLAKELADVRLGGAFSLKDVVWDAAGVAFGLTLVAGID